MRSVLEKYEWDRTWIEKSDEAGKRILYIGDSISCGTRGALNEIAPGGIFFDGFGTSKALDNPYFFPSLSLFAKQEEHIDAVLFNNGLHGWHISEEEYAKLYNEFLDKLASEFSSIPIIPVLTTFVTNPDYHNDRVIIRNNIVKELSKSKKLEILDFYSVSEENKHLQSSDGVHFSEEGYRLLAYKILEFFGKGDKE